MWIMFQCLQMFEHVSAELPDVGEVLLSAGVVLHAVAPAGIEV